MRTSRAIKIDFKVKIGEENVSFMMKKFGFVTMSKVLLVINLQITWCSYEEHYYKLNIDGSSLDNLDRFGHSDLIRNSYGEWVIGFNGSCGTITSLNAELTVIHCELELF
ncbi:hypothetical protein CR513_54515, partial [Mucuna pruriens]